MSLASFLTSVLTGTLALGPAVFAVFEYLGLAASLAPERKRFVVAVVAAVLGVGTWSLAVNLGYVPVPADRGAIAEAIWQYGILAGGSAFTSSSLIHGFVRRPGTLTLKAATSLYSSTGLVSGTVQALELNTTPLKCPKCPKAACGLCQKEP